MQAVLDAPMVARQAEQAKAADQELAPAQTRIGEIYEGGPGVAQDYHEAMRWYRMAADRGDAEANMT